MTLFTSSSWSLLRGAAAAGEQAAVCQGEAPSDPFTGYIYKHDHPVETGAAFTFDHKAGQK